MKNRKWFFCRGLAFTDYEDMEILHQYALEGWIFKEFKYMGYMLYRDVPQNIIFSYDMPNLKKADQEEYFRYFEASGWERIPGGYNGVYFYRAIQGTTPLHSETVTRQEEYKPLLTTSIVILLVGIVLLIMARSIENDAMIWVAGLGGGCIGGGVISTLGTLFRVKKKRLRLGNLTFKQGIVIFILGILVLVGRIWWMPNVEGFLRFLLMMISFGLLVFGWIAMIVQYPLYRDKKEIIGIKKEEEKL